MMFVQAWLRRWYFIPLLFIVSAIAYLPHVNEFGYFRDDWYLMYSANALGVKTFESIFAIDRPARTFLMSVLFSLFDLEPIGYNIFAYIFRVLGALSFLWSLHILWPRQRTMIVIAAIFFLIYPGFLSMPNAIDYEEKYVGLFLGHLSIALSLRSVISIRRRDKLLLWLPIVLTAAAYPALVEYYFGLEVFRLLAIGLLVRRDFKIGLSQWIKTTLCRWVPFLPGPFMFVLWRFFIFESARKATDLGAQIGRFFEAPLIVGIEWAGTLLKNSIESALFAWGIPLAGMWDTPLRLREMFLAGILILCAILSVALFLKIFHKDDLDSLGDMTWQDEALWIGLICIVAGLIPVILSNREADFFNYSRYLLPSSSGAVIFLISFLGRINPIGFRNATIFLLVGFSVLTHYLNGLQWARSSQAMREFWWQVYWRIPQLEENTTLVVNYSGIALEEDYFIWGPANLMYHPQSMDLEKIRPAIWGMVLTGDGVASILADAEPVAINRRSILTYMGYDNILILSQPMSDSCVHIIDGKFPVSSEFERGEFRSIVGKSNIKNVALDKQVPVPPQAIFGDEPDRNWCYYYEKASLSLQQGEYETVLNLKQQAKKQGFSPNDPVEWMPFLQAAVVLGEEEEVLEIARVVKKSLYLQNQACELFLKLPDIDPEMISLVQRTFCTTK